MEDGGPDPRALILSNTRFLNHLGVNNLEMMKVVERQEPGRSFLLSGTLVMNEELILEALRTGFIFRQISFHLVSETLSENEAFV